jgi:two-component system sensor kinase FixL
MFLCTQAELAGSAISTLFSEFTVLKGSGKAVLLGRRQATTFPAEVAWARLNPPAHNGFLVTVRDATERQLAEEQLRDRDVALSRAMRFAMAGELASALTHELNQPITALVSYLNASEILAAQSANVDERLQTTLSKAAREAMRGSNVLQRLRNFYQTGELRRDFISLPALLGAVTTVFHDRLRRTGTSIELTCDPTLPEIRGDHTQIEIVLHNLIANSIDAVEAEPTVNQRVEIHATRDDRHVLIHVEDSGPGIAETQEEHLFEPFTTTKPDGMGLGLAISRTLARARGGDLSYSRSRRLGGACFTMRLPLLDPADPRFI